MPQVRIMLIVLGTLILHGAGRLDTTSAQADAIDDYAVIKTQGGGGPSGIQPQERIFLRLGNIKGRATTKGFNDQIVVETLAYQINQAGEWEDGTRLSGRVTTFGDFKFVKLVDASSPSLALACAMKEQFPRAEITLTSGKDVFMKVLLGRHPVERGSRTSSSMGTAC